MKRWIILPMLAMAVLLAGCAAPTVRSDVTVFHEWPTGLAEKSFVFERTVEQDNNLEYRNYENLVQNELLKLGFQNATTQQAAKLKVALGFGMNIRDVRVVEPVLVDRYWPGGGFYGPRWSGRGYHGPFHNPLWYGIPDIQYQESNFQIFKRRLNVVIAQKSGGKKLYDVTVESEGTVGALATVMPYMIRSAFVDFPGKSGTPRRIEIKME